MSPEKCRVRQKLRQKGGDRQKIKINRCPQEQAEKGKEAQREGCRRDPEKQRSRDSERARESKTREKQVQERDRRTGLLGRSRKTGTEGKGIQSPVKTLCRCWWWGREEAGGEVP